MTIFPLLWPPVLESAEFLENISFRRWREANLKAYSTNLLVH